jgi:hypothetical protein
MMKTREQLRVRLSPDQYQAFLVCDDPATVDWAIVVKFLNGSGVVYGVRKDAAEQLAGANGGGHEILVAEGTHPIAGKDGWVEYFFDTKTTGTLEEKSGKVDLRELHMIHNVLRGQALIRIHPPEPGTAGTTVTGKIVAPPVGRKASARPGPNTAFAENDPNVINATADGNVVLRRDGSVEVQPLLTINGNVDFSTGNIDFVGSVIVTGDVKSDFSVKVKKDLEVAGNVEDALIEAEGDVTIRKGFLGYGKGKVTAGGSVKVQHLVNQTIFSDKDVTIEKESVAGMVTAGGRIVAPQASIVGGMLDAASEVDVNNLGTGEHSQARVKAGRRGRIMDRLAQIDKDAALIEKQTVEVKEAAYRLVRTKLDGGTLNSEKEQLLAKLQDVQKILPQRIATLEEEKRKLHVELQKVHDARIVIRGTVFENVLVEINGVRRMVDSALEDVVFVERGGKIEIRST